MNGNKSKKSNRINITNPVYTVITSDTPEGTTYGEVKSMGEAMQIQLTPSIAEGKLHGNGVEQENIAKLTGIAVSFDLNKLYIETRAEILGNQYENGVLIEKAGDEAPYIALGYEVEQTGGTKEQVWLLKGSARPLNSTVQQQNENINFSTDTVSINFIPRTSDGQLRFFGDTANADYTEEQAKNFFKEGPVSYPKPTTPGV